MHTQVQVPPQVKAAVNRGDVKSLEALLAMTDLQIRLVGGLGPQTLRWVAAERLARAETCGEDSTWLDQAE